MVGFILAGQSASLRIATNHTKSTNSEHTVLPVGIFVIEVHVFLVVVIVVIFLVLVVVCSVWVRGGLEL